MPEGSRKVVVWPHIIIIIIIIIMIMPKHSTACVSLCVPGRLWAWAWGPLASTDGGSRTAFHCVPKSVPPEYSTVCGPGTLLGTFGGPRNVVPRVPLTLTTGGRLTTPLTTCFDVCVRTITNRSNINVNVNANLYSSLLHSASNALGAPSTADKASSSTRARRWNAKLTVC